MQTLAHEISGRFRIIGRQTGHELEEFAADVREGLTGMPKRLSSRYLYDRRGSWLFERICDLDEYYLTRAEARILERDREDILDAIEGHASLIELGSGSSVKTRILLGGVLSRGFAPTYIPIDVSREMLAHSGASLLRRFPSLNINALAAEYGDALDHADDAIEGPKCILWLGSSIGNLERDAAAKFVKRIRSCMNANDRALVGIDLRKDASVLEAAYDDSSGVTRAFNTNLLMRINRELGGDFDISTFGYRADYDVERGRVNMYQVSDRAQSVSVDALGLIVKFDAGESILTESSIKYSFQEIDALAEQSGLRIERQWIDRRDGFTLNLFAPR